MRKIKFRGIDKVTGKKVYGYYNPFCGDEELPMIEVKEGSVAIEPDSVAQLVGYDKNGKEIYEGDELTNADGKIYIAHWETAYRSTDLIIRNRNLTNGCALVLKEKKS